MKNKIRNINKDIVKRKKFLKKEIKFLILKSIIQNLNTKPVIRAYAYKKIIKIQKKSYLSKQNNNICLKTGRFKGALNITQLSRHYIKKLSLNGSLQNIKIKSW